MQPMDPGDFVAVLSRALEIKEKAMRVTNEAARLNDGAMELKSETVEKAADPFQREQLELDKARVQARRDRTQKTREASGRKKPYMDAMHAELAEIRREAHKQAEAMAAAKAARAQEAKKRMEAKARARQEEEERRRAARAKKTAAPKEKPLFMRMEEKGERFLAMEEAAKQRKYEMERGNIRKMKTTSIIRGTAQLMSDVVALLQADEDENGDSQNSGSKSSTAKSIRPVVTRRMSGPPSRPREDPLSLSKEKSESMLPSIPVKSPEPSLQQTTPRRHTRDGSNLEPRESAQGPKILSTQVSLPKISTAVDSGDMAVNRSSHQVLPSGLRADHPQIKPQISNQMHKVHRAEIATSVGKSLANFISQKDEPQQGDSPVTIRPRKPVCVEAGTSVGKSLVGSTLWVQAGMGLPAETSVYRQPSLTEVVAFDVTICEPEPMRPPSPKLFSTAGSATLAVRSDERVRADQEEEEEAPKPIPPLFSNWEDEVAAMDQELSLTSEPLEHNKQIPNSSNVAALDPPAAQAEATPTPPPAPASPIHPVLGNLLGLTATGAAAPGAGGTTAEASQALLMKVLQDTLLGALTPGTAQPQAAGITQAVAPAPDHTRRSTETGESKPPSQPKVTVRRDSAVGSLKKAGQHLARKHTTGKQYAARDAPAQYSYQANKKAAATDSSANPGRAAPAKPRNKAPRPPTLEEMERAKWPKSAGGTGPGLTAEQKLARLQKRMANAPPVRSRNMAPKPWQRRLSVSAA